MYRQLTHQTHITQNNSFTSTLSCSYTSGSWWWVSESRRSRCAQTNTHNWKSNKALMFLTPTFHHYLYCIQWNVSVSLHWWGELHYSECHYHRISASWSGRILIDISRQWVVCMMKQERRVEDRTSSHQLIRDCRYSVARCRARSYFMTTRRLWIVCWRGRCLCPVIVRRVSLSICCFCRIGNVWTIH